MIIAVRVGATLFEPRWNFCSSLLLNCSAPIHVALDPLSVAAADSYRFHPALLDAAMQLVLELLRVDDRLELYLPVGVDRIEVSRAVGTEAYCLVRNAFRADSVLGADIFIYDQSHNPIAVLQGCRCRALETSSSKSSAQALAWHWEPKLVDGVPPLPSSWRLFGFSADDMASAAPQCSGRLIPDLLFEKFRMRGD